LNYSEFCSNPLASCEILSTFVGVQKSKRDIQNLAQKIQIQNSHDRFKNRDLSFFDYEQLEYIKILGFGL